MRRMNSEFEALIKPDEYQIFLFTCPASLPVSFAAHPWFVINRKGMLSRWEIFWYPELAWLLRWGHLHKDYYTPFQGIDIIPLFHRGTWSRVHLLGSVEGELARAMADFIEASPETYPHCRNYVLRGPNSNTYAQWVLNKFPECGLRLPWNSFGKNLHVWAK